jgi:hypothetical protein
MDAAVADEKRQLSSGPGKAEGPLTAQFPYQTVIG